MSFWLTEELLAPIRSTPELPEEVVDVAVIGGGITGASVAYHVSKTGASCVLLERKGISAGATGSNGGFIAPGTSEKFGESLKRYGVEVTRTLYDYTVACTEAVAQYVEEQQVDCELRFNGSVSLAFTDSELAGLRSSHAMLREHGVPAEWWDAEECERRTGSGSFLGGMFKPNAGNLWPAKLVLSMALQAQAQGANLQTHTDVLRVHDPAEPGAEDEDVLVVTTSRGVVRARHVVFCTNAWTRGLLPDLQGVITPVRNQVIITKPLPPLWPFGLSSNHGYEYFMQRPDGRIVLGGMRDLVPSKEEDCDDEQLLNPTVSRALRTYLPKHFPAVAAHIRNASLSSPGGVEGEEGGPILPPLPPPLEGEGELEVEVDAEWVGILAFTADRNPLVGPLQRLLGRGGRHRAYIAAGYTGHGMPVAFLAGRNLAEMIVGASDDPPAVPLPDAYLPQRLGL
mmetsp:Transcript_435/g.954  ORF Transcript_435/g.954 Transcript_435/m.954 type:complete len:455 (-) Transcript_435:152-1516(-)